jgi:glyoxylase-like metal-dependent hydrolase (beta-lactamase superfamily II)
MLKKIKENVWQFSFKKFGSYVYLIKTDKKNILIDTSSPQNTEELKEYLKKLNLYPKEIDIVILTHHHWDHTGGILLFLDSKIYGSKKDFGENITDIKKLKIPELRIIETPGHSKGSICILYKNILFSGDTLFNRGLTGRTDLPGGSEKEMKESLNKLKKLNYKILCPGHGYE